MTQFHQKRGISIYYLGIGLGGINIAAGTVDKSGKLLLRQSMPSGASCTPQELCDRISEVAREAISAAGQPVDSVGIDCPDSVDRNMDMIELTPNLPLRHFSMREELENRLHLPVGVDSDANAAAWGEFKASALQGAWNAVTIALGTGVGSGLILDGKIYTGQSGAAGGMGHIIVGRHDRSCNCGGHGYWERYTSTAGPILTTRELLEQGTAHESLVWEMLNGGLSRILGRSAPNAMRQGDILGREIVEIYTEDTAYGVINIIDSLQLDVICVGGGISREGETLLAPVRAIVEREQFVTDSPLKAKLVTAELGNSAGIIGAALSGAELCGFSL